MTSHRRRVCFRVDAGSQRGLSFGHLFRCLEIANELKASHDIESVFVMRDITEGIETAKNFGLNLISLSQDLSVEDEVEALLEVPGDTIIFDLIDAETRDFSPLHKIGKKTIALDDFGNKSIAADILINGSAVKETRNYPVPGGLKQEHYLGPEYCVIGNRFGQTSPAPINSQARHILATFGGSDPTNLSSHTADALLELPNTFQVTILLGPGYKKRDFLAGIVAQRNQPGFSIKKNVPDVLSEILWADIVITAGGRMVYEVAATGTPLIMIPSIEHEEPVSSAIAGYGAGIDLGRWKPSTKKLLLKEIEKLGSRKARQLMQRRQLGIIDGLGLARVSNVIAQSDHPYVSSS